MSRILPFPIFLLTAAALAAADAPTDSSVNKTPVVLDRFVVSDNLDKAREDIVPSLGAAEFHIDRVQIDAQALGASAGFNEVLLRVPGVAQDSFGQVHVRGEHADLQYRINDVLLPEGLSGFGQELDTRFVDSVAMLTGALPAQFGYRTAGVVDIHTRGGSAQPGGDMAFTAGSFGTLRASAESTAEHGPLGSYLTVSDERSDLGVENPTASREAIHDRKNQFKTFGYVSDVINDTSRLNFMFSTSFARFQIPNNPGQTPAFTLAGTGSFNSADLDENQREENHYAILAYQKTAGPVSAQLSVFTRYSLVSFTPDRAGDLVFNGVASSVHRTIVGNGFEADAKWSLGGYHTLRAGALATSTNAGTRTITAVFPTDLNGDQSSTTPFDIVDRQRKLGWLTGVYLQDEWQPIQPVTLNLGARADASHGFLNEGQLSPRVNLVYQFGDNTSLHAGYARYFTPPPLELISTGTVAKFDNTTNASAIDTSSAVRSERADYFDAGLSFKLTPNLTATLDGYAKRATDLLDEGQFGAALIFSPFNFRRGHTEGVELSMNYSREGFSAYGNIALGRATAREIVSGEFQFDPAELTYIGTHDVNLDHEQTLTASTGTSYRFGGTLVYADVLYGSGLRDGFANTSHLPSYYPLNLGLDHTFQLNAHREVHVRLDLVNAFDQIYELRDGSGIGVGAPQFGSRRGLFGGATLAF